MTTTTFQFVGLGPRLVRLSQVLVLALLILSLGACGGRNTGGPGNNNNEPIPCETVDQCPPGWDCQGNICVAPTDGGIDADTSAPVIHVIPTELDFGSPLLGVEETRTFEISNEGDADLVVERIEVLEPGSLREYSTVPEGIVNLTIPPGQRSEVQVTLVSVDDELDTGQVRVTSNDPVTPEVLVDLLSEYKGIPNLEACVFSEDASPPYPTYPFTACEVNSNGDPVIDFEIVQYQTPEERVLVVYNTAQGNHPLSISDIAVTNNSGNANTYTVELFTQDPQSGDATPAVLPLYLSAGDQNTDPDLLYIRVAFDASVDIFPTEQLVISSNDPDAGQTYIDIIGVVTGCPQDYWDINGDPADGCEYYCEFLQTTEDCNTPGVDDNCNGETDEAGADNCVVYYRDHDGDGFGDPNDSQCLCATSGEYNTTNNQDCDDSLATGGSVNPNASETCATPYDDNCDGNTNDDNAAQCVTHYRDEDGDGFGLNSDARCLCQAEGLYTTTTGNDCDDDPAQCGANCNPNQSEVCTTPVDYDNDCDGIINEQNASGCTTYYRDLDGDGYGDSGFSQCWCDPSGDYSTTDPTDCDDNPAQCGANCYPGNTEVCDNRDNDCDGQPDSTEFNFQTNPNHCGGCNITCTASPQSECGETGNCVGGDCEVWAFGTICAAQVCTGGVQQNADICNGTGGCWDQGTVNCSPFGCDAAGIACRTSCTQDSHCANGFYCNASNNCLPKLVNGTTCGRAGMCVSGFCADGVCCNNACTGTCRACNRAGSLGTCSNHTINTDPDGECGGTCQSCNGSGACRNTPQGLDPEAECPAQAASTCGTTGVCSGSATCEYWPSGTVCGDQLHCDSGTPWVQINADLCNGTGTCVDGGTQNCSPYICENNVCRTDCINDGDCRSGNFCITSDCCAPSGASSGNTCGTGTLNAATGGTTTTTYNFTGRLVPTGDENWYRFRVAEDASHRASITAWFTSNPAQEFEMVIRKTAYGTTTCGTPTTECGGTGHRCYESERSCVPPDGLSCTGTSANTYYIGVRRDSAAVPTCSQYSLRVVVGGNPPPAPQNCN